MQNAIIFRHVIHNIIAKMPLLPGSCRERNTVSVLFSAFKMTHSMYRRDTLTLGTQAFDWIRLTLPQEAGL